MLKIKQDEKNSFGNFLKGIIVGFLICGLFVSSFFIGRLIYRNSIHTAGMETKSGEEPKSVISTDTLQKVKTIEEAINTYYYGDEVTTKQLQDGLYKGMVESLGDPYSEYYTKEELEEVENSNQGISYGIGAYISLNQKMDTAMISGVMEDAPAQKVGLREGDIIYKVDGAYTQGMSISKVVSMVKGREGTSVHLTIYREGEADYLEFDVDRGKLIETTTVDSGMITDTDGIGYLRIREFDTITVDQFTEAMAELKGNDMKALILDLRSNPGGNLNAVVNISRKLLPKGLIVYTEDKAGNKKEYSCDGTNELQIPMVVLVNEYSASASEILAGAIQDYHKGTLVGTTTYGKGIVQNIHDLNDGTALKLTISAYFTPSGKNIHGVGIEPDVELEYDYDANEKDGSDNQVDKAVEILTEELKK